MRFILVLPALLLASACTTLPTGPSVLVLPGSGKSFDTFRTDDMACRQFAYQQVGGSTPKQAATETGVRDAAIGTAVGAAAGAAIDGSHGAGVGAGAGLLVGALAGAGSGESSAYEVQRRYDYGYIQCMYANGHRVPVSGRLMAMPRPGTAVPPPPPSGTPPPDTPRR
jgi:YMGG-like Gly-zipper